MKKEQIIIEKEILKKKKINQIKIKKLWIKWIKKIKKVKNHENIKEKAK